MSRIRPFEALVGAAATVAVTLPLFTLFQPGTWFRPAVLGVATVTLVGMAARRVLAARPLVVVVQLVALLLVAAWIHLQGHLWGDVVPLRDAVVASGNLLQEAYLTVVNYSAPAPSNRGISFALTLLVGLVALAVDAVAATYRSPALAGVPLLAAFLTSATNSAGGLSAWYVVPPAACWLALIHGQGLRALRQWGASASRASGPLADPADAFATVGRVVGVTALAAAVAIPAFVPHLPTTFLADGLGTSDDGRGRGGGAVRLSTSIDIARDLGDRSTEPVLVYETTAESPPPLRVGILDVYRRGRWQASSDFTFVPLDGRLLGAQAAPDVPRREERMTVKSNAIGLPQVALPDGAAGSPFADGTWRVTADGVVELTQRTDEYSVDFVELEPTDGQFSAPLEADAPERDDLVLDPRSEEEVRTLLAQVIDDGDTPVEIARKIQSHLRGSEYTYSLELAEETAEGVRPEEPLVRFLETKRGYCVQFATAMIMLSRAAGIPARMAVGFLPGSADGEERVVRVSDAHAWPELYFPRLGWVRFEPTPGTRSGTAPEYSLEPTEGGGTSPQIPTGGASAPSVAPSGQPGQEDVTADDSGTVDGSLGSSVGSAVRDRLPEVLVILGLLLALAVVPVGAWLARRRARRIARDDAERVEAEWQSLLLRLQDIGLTPPDGATPRQASKAIGRDAYLTPEENEALGRVVTTLEQARYARPGAELPDVADDSRTVWRAALSRRRRGDRARALLLPEEGRRHWRDRVGSAGSKVVGAVGSAVRRFDPRR